jgi:hypothetical protein
MFASRTFEWPNRTCGRVRGVVACTVTYPKNDVTARLVKNAAGGTGHRDDSSYLPPLTRGDSERARQWVEAARAIAALREEPLEMS